MYYISAWFLTMIKIIHYFAHLFLTCSGFHSLVRHTLTYCQTFFTIPCQFLAVENVSCLSGSKAKLSLKGVGLWLLNSQHWVVGQMRAFVEHQCLLCVSSIINVWLHMLDNTNRKANFMPINFWKRYLLPEFLYPMGPASCFRSSPPKKFLIPYISFFKSALFLTYNPTKLSWEIRHIGKDSIPIKTPDLEQIMEILCFVKITLIAVLLVNSLPFMSNYSIV